MKILSKNTSDAETKDAAAEGDCGLYAGDVHVLAERNFHPVMIGNCLFYLW